MDPQPPSPASLPRLSRRPLIALLFILAALCLWVGLSLSVSERPLADASVATPQPLNPLQDVIELPSTYAPFDPTQYGGSGAAGTPAGALGPNSCSDITASSTWSS